MAAQSGLCRTRSKTAKTRFFRDRDHLQLIIVPFVRSQFVIGKFGEGVDEVGAEVGVDVLREKLPVPVPVLGPVGVVADSQEWMCWNNRTVMLLYMLTVTQTD